MTKIFTLLIVFVGWLNSGVTYAEDIQFHGFLTQGYVKTDHNAYFGDSEHGSLDFRELGLGVQGMLTKDIDFSALILSRKAGGMDNSQIKLDHALLNYKLFQDESTKYTVRLGRIKIPFGLYNETRDVASTRPSILLPQSIYFDNARQYLISADGVQLVRESWSGDSYDKWYVALQQTNGVNNKETESYFLGLNWPGKFKAKLAHGIRYYHSDDNDRNQYAAYVADNHIEYNQGQGDWLSAGSIKAKVLWLSLHKEFGEDRKFGVTTELFLPRLEYKGFGAIIPDKVSFPQGYYIQVEYRPNGKVEFFSRYDVSYTDRSDKQGTALSAATGKPGHTFFAKDFTIGGKYHINSSLEVSAEVHRINGTGWLPTIDNPIPADTKQHWNMLITQITFTF